MRLFFLSAVTALALAGAANGQNLASGTPVWANVVSSCGSASYSAGQPYSLTQDTTGTFCTKAGSATPAGTNAIGALLPYAATQTPVSASSGFL